MRLSSAVFRAMWGILGVCIMLGASCGSAAKALRNPDLPVPASLNRGARFVDGEQHRFQSAYRCTVSPVIARRMNTEGS